MPTLSFEPLHPDFGAVVTGIDMSRPLDDGEREAILEAIDTWSFLCFPDQDFDDERQLALTRSLGEPEASHVAYGQERKIQYFNTIGNVQPDGTAVGASHKKTVLLSGNYMWHTDSSFRETPAFVSIMCPYETPDEGGETQFVSNRAAWARLPAERQEELEPLVAIHDYVFSRSKVAPDAVTPEFAATLPPVRQRLVRRNPRSGVRNLYIGSHAREIEGWEEAESRALLDGLVEHATAEPHVYTHRWQPGQLVIWDNRCLLHRGTGYNADRYRRYMRQTRVCDSGPTLEE